MAARKVRAGRIARKIRQYERPVIPEEGEGAAEEEQARTKNEDKMKSQSAKYQIMLKSNGDEISTKSAEEAVELAEEDMIDKAVNAFCFSKCGYGPCIMKENGRSECKELWTFKRKMEE